MNKINRERLIQLSNAMGASGEEGDVRQILRNSFHHEIIQDRLGSLFCKLNGKQSKAKLMIATSLDEQALMIEEILDDGSMKFVSLENISPASLLHQRVTVYDRKHQAHKGTIVTKKTKFMETALETIHESDLYIDCGYNYEICKSKITTGDLVVIGDTCVCINEDTCMGKALQHRSMLEVILELYEQLQGSALDFDIVFGGISQSVIGWRGTKTATYVVQPDCAIALTGFDCADSNIHRKDGVIAGYYDKQMLPSQKLLKDYIQVHPHTKSYFGFLGNDGSFIHKTIKGTPCLSLGVAMNNMGSANTMVDLNDLEQLVQDLKSYILQLDAKKIQKMNFGVQDVN
ncbi:hypothetical protein [Bulleidia sp. zg-1006]|uniref:hypothetical protein n=1 Tax=Bulleidia sp. zg-1006 TaxID=2806552 RepID=UPI00193A5E03|nr:hypothetical protein [Bulleidia sp. zg-1006]QRG86494.1 hypothetical protein JOS54_06500 [Bulleidia sp. zg-1006]